MTPADLDMAIRTIWGEAAGEGPEGQRAVAAVIANRARAAGMSPTDVVLAPGQFEPWASRRPALEGLDPNSPEYRRIADAVTPILRGEADDPTGGATHFYSPTTQAAFGRRPPSWDDGTGRDIGRHRFFALPYKGRPATPQTAAAEPSAADPITPQAPPQSRPSDEFTGLADAQRQAVARAAVAPLSAKAMAEPMIAAASAPDLGRASSAGASARPARSMVQIDPMRLHRALAARRMGRA